MDTDGRTCRSLYALFASYAYAPKNARNILALRLRSVRFTVLTVLRGSLGKQFFPTRVPNSLCSVDLLASGGGGGLGKSIYLQINKTHTFQIKFGATLVLEIAVASETSVHIHRTTRSHVREGNSFNAFCFFFDGATAPRGPGPPHYRGFTITLRHTTLGRTALDVWSASPTRLYLTTHNTHKRQASMPPAGFESPIHASERPQTTL
jgi:hypothetical protein